jgi:hypothetical protein
MDIGGDDRAVTVQIGAVLLFGVLIVSLSIYQATVVPSENQQVEYRHSQTVQGEMQEVRGAILRSAATGVSQSESITVGTTYPGRTFFVNPPPASGTLRTVGTEDPNVDVVIDNADAAKAGDPEAGDYWDGDPRPYSTGALTYQPDYHEYDGAPTIRYENTVLANQFESGTTLLRSEQVLVDGRNLQIVTLAGDVSRSTAESETITVRPVSVAEDSIAVRNEDGENIEVTFVTGIAPSRWEDELLAGEIDPGAPDDDGDPDAYVAEFASSSVGPDTWEITLTLERGVSYDLTMGRVAVGSYSGPGTDAEYVTVVEQPTTLPEGGTGAITVEVRDAYNNPVSGVTVNRGSVSDGSVDPPSDVTNADGRATFTYTAPSTGGEAVEGASLSFGGNDTETERVRTKVTVYNVGGGESLPGDPANAPTAEFTYSSNGPTANGKWDFDASGSSDPNDDIASYEWDLDEDGNFDDATGETLTEERVSSGTQVTLRVTDSEGNSDTQTKTVS